MKQAMDWALDVPIQAFSRARSIGFSLESRILDTVSKVLTGRGNRISDPLPENYEQAIDELFTLFRKDSLNIREGVYPWDVLLPESPLSHLLRLPKVALDDLRLAFRRKRGRTTEFSEEASEFLDDLPRYYRRNFHFQSNGYLSERSAEIYEHQVEILFRGSADAMRRLILPPMKDAFGSSEGKGMKILEIGAGTGRATRFVQRAFPKARITATDLSAPYLRHAQAKFTHAPLVDFLAADGAHLPFLDGQYDAVYSVFLFHELPLEARLEVLRESVRVLKPGGFLGLVDSLQSGDNPIFAKTLEEFHENFHEPFFRNYLASPVDGLLAQTEGLTAPSTELGFLSKVCWAFRKK